MAKVKTKIIKDGKTYYVLHENGQLVSIHDTNFIDITDKLSNLVRDDFLLLADRREEQLKSK